MSLLTPDTQPPARPTVVALATSGAPPTLTVADEAVNLQSRILYIRSYLLMRSIIGLVGITLPIVLVVGDHLLDPGAPGVRDALSDYYYSGMRDFLVGGLISAAVFLITYKIFEKSVSNVLSLVAGVAAFAIAFFPTNRPDGVTTPLTPLQNRLGEETVSAVHYASAGVFIVAMAIISLFFGIQEGRRSPQRAGQLARMSPTFWRWFHWVDALLIVLAVAFIGLAKIQGQLNGHKLFIGEVVAIVAFGLSWLLKGLELDVLLGPRAARRRWEREAAKQNP